MPGGSGGAFLEGGAGGGGLLGALRSGGALEAWGFSAVSDARCAIDLRACDMAETTVHGAVCRDSARDATTAA